MITVYSKNNCIQCKMVKRYLAAHEVAFQEINIDEHPDKIDWLKSQGFQSVPVIIQGEKKPIVGFSPDELKAMAM